MTSLKTLFLFCMRCQMVNISKLHDNNTIFIYPAGPKEDLIAAPCRLYNKHHKLRKSEQTKKNTGQFEPGVYYYYLRIKSIQTLADIEKVTQVLFISPMCNLKSAWFYGFDRTKVRFFTDNLE